MPKELHEITKFTSGTITVPDEKDIPEDAASYSLNIDSVTEGGKLKGVPADFYLVNDGTFAGSGTAETCDASKLAMINNGGQRDIIWYDTDDNKLNSITDIYGTIGRADLATNTSSADEVTMQVHNKEVHIGMGRGSADTPQWVGYVDHKQFGTAVTAIQKEDAELKSPGSFPAIYKVIKIGSDVFGIQYGGTRIYRFSETAFVSASSTEFVSTQGISIVGAGTDLWVYDNNTAFGTMYKIDVSEWGTEDEVSQENNIGGWGGVGTALDSGFEISDMHDDDAVGTKIWFFAYKSGNIASTADANWLYNVDIPSANGAITPDKRTPKLAAGSADGDWVSTGPTAVLFKQCLVAGGNGVVGIGVMIHLTFSGALIVSAGGGTTQAFANGLCMFSVGDTYPDKTPIEITPSGTDDHQLHEIINGSAASSFGGTSYWGGFYQDTVSLLVAIRASATSTSIKAFGDIAYSDVTTSPSAHFSAPTLLEISSDDVNVIDADGLCMTYDTGDDVIYMCENNSGGGYIDINYDASAAFSDIDYLERSDIRVSFSDVADGEFQDDDTYFWKFAYMYDEYQESPLSAHVSYTPADNKHVQLTIDLYNLSGLSKRVSHLMVYRAENSTAASKISPDSFYRLVKKIKLDTSFALMSDNWGVDASGTTALDARRHIFVDELNTIGSSYESRNLMPETLETSMLNYALSTQINSMHVVGKCYKTEIADAMNYLFKSKVNNFDQFDWTTDFLRLPTVPTALASFNGRIYAFDENNTYRINPQGFYVEDTFEGAGCFGSDAVVVTEYGMCYCDKNNIYLHDGKSPKPIASSILTGDATYSWHNIDTTRTPMVMFDAKRKSFVIFFSSLEASGTHTGGDSATVLIDSAASFTSSLVGARAFNITDGSDGVVSSVDSGTQITLYDLLGGSDNSWDNADDDVYRINKHYAWSYNVIYNRWDLLHFSNSDFPQGILHGKNGEMYVSAGQADQSGKLVHFLGSTSTSLDLWEWQSKYMTMGEDTMKKMLYDVKVVGDATAPTVTYGVDGDTTPTTALSSGKVASGDKKSKSLQVKITQVAGATHKVDSVGVLYRRLPKTSGNI